MARMNVTPEYPELRTAEGAPAMRITPLLELRRSVLTALLWEDGFYESGKAHAKRVAELVPQCNAADVAALAIECRDQMYLRHVPLYLVRQLAKIKGNGTLVASTLEHVIQRPDEMGEYLAMYWGGKASGTPKRPEPISAGSKRALGRVFAKFKAETLAKYDRDAAVKLLDILRLVHPKPKDAAQAATWKKLITRTLESPDTWEVVLSAGTEKKSAADKKASFERLLRENKMGGLAFLRNLRNFMDAGVDTDLIRARFDGEFRKVLPFRFIAALRHAPAFAAALEGAMLRSTADMPKLAGSTAVLVDVSGSMDAKMSGKSEMLRCDAASALAVLVRELTDFSRVFSFSDRLVEVPNYRGLALVSAIGSSQPHSSTHLGQAVRALSGMNFDRIIVITDEQSHDRVDHPKNKAYMINVATNANGVGYGPWIHIDGFSERILDFVRAIEAEPAV